MHLFADDQQPTTLSSCDARLLASPTHDELVRPLIVACLVTASRLPPRGDGMPPARSLALTTAMRMVNRVHRNAAIVRPLAQPSRSSRFADRDVLVIDISYLADGRHAILRNFAGLAQIGRASCR